MTRAERHEQVLDAWAAGLRLDEISASTGMPVSSIGGVLTAARKRGDGRAHWRAHAKGNPHGTGQIVPSVMPTDQRELVLDLWHAGRSLNEISAATGASVSPIGTALGDPRAHLRPRPRIARPRRQVALSSLVWAFQRMPAVIRLALDGGEADHGGTIQTDGDS